MRSRIHSKKCSIIDINRNSDQAAVHLPGCLFILVHIKKPRQGLTGRCNERKDVVQADASASSFSFSF